MLHLSAGAAIALGLYWIIRITRKIFNANSNGNTTDHGSFADDGVVNGGKGCLGAASGILFLIFIIVGLIFMVLFGH